MANQQTRARQLFRYGSFHINKSQPLGHGAYGAVYKAKCDQLLCAAKVLHPTILDPYDPGGAGRVMERFQQECALLESIRHPNIVQYLGMTRDPQSRLPVLLMELLDESLTKMLKLSQQSLPYYIQVDICHDIALAVAYLHSNDIIHRDLSSNNVLIMAKSRAKVTDFGMSKLAGAAPSRTPLTMCPGTVPYMPPEALHESPVYTKKLDCFSEGVIMIQVCTRLWPEPGPRIRTVQDPRSPTGTTQMPILEPERRKNHIDMIDPDHGLLLIAVDCLHYQEKKRASSEELCQRLAGLKETREYRESVEQTEKEQNDIAQLKRQMEEIQLREATTVQQLHDKYKQQQRRYQSDIQSKDIYIKQLEIQNQKLNQQLEEQEQVTAEFQRTNNILERQVNQLQQTQQSTKPSQPPLPIAQRVRGRQLQQDPQPVKKKQPQPSQQQVHHQKPQPPIRQIKWRGGGRAPHAMARGATAVNGNVAYFVSWSGRTHSYDSSIQRWRELPKCPHEGISLVVIQGVLTAIGGHTGYYDTDKLLSIINDQDKRWIDHFPSMPTKRMNTIAVTTKQHLIVAGGESGPKPGESGPKFLDTVEVMDVESLVWSTAARLRIPHPYSKASAAICGDHLYILGGNDKDGGTKSVLTCSLTKLLQSCSKTSITSVWHKIADVPVYHSTCAAVNGELVAIGGNDAKLYGTIHKYNPTTDSWNIVSNMSTARRWCLVAVFPTGEVMVVGGDVSSGSWQRDTDKIELAYL